MSSLPSDRNITVEGVYWSRTRGSYIGTGMKLYAIDRLGPNAYMLYARMDTGRTWKEIYQSSKASECMRVAEIYDILETK